MRYATTDDLVVTATHPTSISTQVSIPLASLPFPARVASLSITSWSVATSVPRSDSDWWLARLRYTRGAVSTAAVAMATKTTRLTDGVEPAGEAIGPVAPWSWSLVDLGPDLLPGDVLSVVLAPRGAPAPIGGPILFTIGYVPC